MIGNNKLVLNQAEINKAVEYYLNSVVFKMPCTVVSVDQNRQDTTFDVKIMPPKESTTTLDFTKSPTLNGIIAHE